MLRNISLVTIVSTICTILRVLIFIKLTHKVSKMKIIDPLYEILGSIVFVLFNCFIFVYLQQYSYWATSILFVVSCLVYLMTLSRNHLIENVILSLTYYITFWFITYAINYLFESLNIVMPLPNFVLDYVAIAIALVIIYIVASKLMPIMIDYKEHDISILQFLMLMIFGVTGFISLVLFNNGFSIALGAMCSISILMLSLYISDKQDNEREKKKLKERNEFLEKQDKMLRGSMDQKYKSFQKSEEANRRLGKINHDLRHHFNYIVSCETLQKVKTYARNLLGQVEEVSKYYDTGSAIVDIILQDQHERSLKKGIVFGVSGGFGDYGLKVEPAKASLIFGNLLDNAFEAAEKVEKGLKKVDVYFHQKPKEEFYLEVKNKKKKGEKLRIVDGKIETSKKDKLLHGMGLENVKKTVESCGGRMKITDGEEDFTVEVWIPEK